MDRRIFRSNAGQRPSAVFTGLATGTVGTASFLYAADFAHGSVDVFDSFWAPATLPGGFTDPNLPSGYAPFNIQNINGNLYVEYAKVNPANGMTANGAGLGTVDIYSTNGAPVQGLASGGQLNAHWGVVIAPSGFGAYGGDVLVGNFGSGEINAFNRATGAFLGTIDGPNWPAACE